MKFLSETKRRLLALFTLTVMGGCECQSFHVAFVELTVSSAGVHAGVLRIASDNDTFQHSNARRSAWLISPTASTESVVERAFNPSLYPTFVSPTFKPVLLDDTLWMALNGTLDGSTPFVETRLLAGKTQVATLERVAQGDFGRTSDGRHVYLYITKDDEVRLWSRDGAADPVDVRIDELSLPMTRKPTAPAAVLTASSPRFVAAVNRGWFGSGTNFGNLGQTLLWTEDGRTFDAGEGIPRAVWADESRRRVVLSRRAQDQSSKPLGGASLLETVVSDESGSTVLAVDTYRDATTVLCYGAGFDGAGELLQLVELASGDLEFTQDGRTTQIPGKPVRRTSCRVFWDGTAAHAVWLEEEFVRGGDTTLHDVVVRDGAILRSREVNLTLGPP
ncbi:MAG: hypothetical protein Q8L48_43300 [Archangium sp.]|nr:hypothetical protein [Archangium sp.]